MLSASYGQSGMVRCERVTPTANSATENKERFDRVPEVTVRRRLLEVTRHIGVSFVHCRLIKRTLARIVSAVEEHSTWTTSETRQQGISGVLV